jgi:hypothetical protein
MDTVEGRDSYSFRRKTGTEYLHEECMKISGNAAYFGILKFVLHVLFHINFLQKNY